MNTSLSLNKNHSLRMYGVSMLYHYTFLKLALHGSKWSGSRSSSFALRGIASGNHWIQEWVGTRAILHAVTKM
jgi:hypothetical protein